MIKILGFALFGLVYAIAQPNKTLSEWCTIGLFFVGWCSLLAIVVAFMPIK